MLGGIARTSPATWHGLGLIVGYAGCKSGQRNCAQIHSLIVGVMVMLVLLLVVLTVGGGGCSGSEGTLRFSRSSGTDRDASQPHWR